MARAASLRDEPVGGKSAADSGPGVAAYVAPFGVFIGFLALQVFFPIPQAVRFAIEIALFFSVSRPALKLPPTRPLTSVLVGIGMFLIWIAPDQLIPGYRSLPLFSNAIFGHPVATTTNAQKHDLMFLLFRVLNSVISVPILEELFWRGFLLRWLIRPNFRTLGLGTWSVQSFWLVAILFASEHGSYWDVGLLAGIAYNAWMLHTRNLWDCILAHAVTNGCLAAFVIAGGQWQYWL